MAKSIRSKVKKRLRSVKRAVVKNEKANPHTKLGTPAKNVIDTLQHAKTGFVPTPKRLRSAFRYDEPDATIPQYNWKQGPDYRAATIGAEAGYALVGAKRPKATGDAPTASIQQPSDEPSLLETEDRGVARLMRGTEQIVPKFAGKKLKRKLKNKSGVETKFRWV